MRSILALLPLLACGETVVEDDVTGILLTARFDVPVARIDVDVLLDAAVTKKGGVDLAEGPAGPRSETIAILLPDDFAGKTVDVRANGSIAGILRIQGTGRAALVLHQLVELTIDLAPPVSPTCGDRAITVGEACDDGNVKDADGCSATCAVEPGYTCNGAPSVCQPICTGPECNPACGDARIDAAEACDDGNQADGDGCSPACSIESGWMCTGEPSTCTMIGVCGDGMIDAEECDDANTSDGDGCSGACTTEAGWVCTGQPSVCALTCGNGAMDAGEECDDANTNDGDGCSASCAIEPGFECGDGLIRGIEACDDDDTDDGDGCSGACEIERGFVCSGEPSACSLCGNQVLDPGEVCDSSTIGDETCLSRGHLTGTLGCNSTCTDYDTGSCGSLIDTFAEIQQAIDEAYAQAGGPEVVAIPAGTYAGNELLFDEQSPPSGLILRPLEGPVTIVGAQLRVRSGSNTIQGIEIRDATNALLLEQTRASAGNNQVRNMLFSYASTTPQQVVRIQSNGNQMVANRIDNSSNGPGVNAIVVDGALRTTLAMNAIYGPFEIALRLFDIQSSLGNSGTFVDHNSVWMPSPATGTALQLDGVDDLCYRNNILWGSGTTTGIDVGVLNFNNSCPDGSGNNLTDNHGTQCTGFACTFLCEGGPLCDLLGDPMFDAAAPADGPLLCLGPGGNALADAGLELGYDMFDDDPALFHGLAPEVGAREAGASRNFGGLVSACPL